MTQGKKQVSALCGTAVVEGLASEERFAEITSGRSSGQQRLVGTCQDSGNEAVAEGRESPAGLAQESVGARTEGQRPLRRRNTPRHVGGNIEIGQRDSGHLAVSLSARLPDSEPAIRRRMGGTRLWANHGGRGACEPALKPRRSWEGTWMKGQGFEPDPGNLAVRDHRGALGTGPWWNCEPTSQPKGRGW